MSNSVDQRIVEMQFDNAQFEKGVASTIESLKTLEKNLDFSSGAKGLSQVQSTIDKLDFSVVDKGIDKFNAALGGIKDTAAGVFTSVTGHIQNVAKAYALVSGIFKTGIAAMAIKGGWGRASSINQAAFKIDAMGIGWKNVQKEVQASVDGTAYSLEAAATSAALFASSGVKAGDEMLNALKATATLASVSGSSFEEIGDIMAKIAAQGKISGMQIDSLAFKGIDAQSLLKKQLHLTDEQLQKARKDGIDLQTFVGAVLNEYPKAAEMANKSFDGSLANMRSALNRHFADLFQYIQAAMPDIFNAIRKDINAVNNAFNSLYRTWKDPKTGELMKGSLIVGLEGTIKNIGKALDLWSRSPGPARLEEMIKDVAKGVEKFFNEFNKGVYELTWGFVLVGAAARDVGKILFYYVKPIFDGIGEAFGKNTFKNIAHNFRMTMENVVAGLQGIKPPKEYVKTVKTFVGGVMALFESVGKGLSGFFDGIGEGLSRLFENGGGPVELVIGALNTFVGVVSSVWKVLSEVLKPVGDLLTKAGLGEIPAIFGSAGKAIELFLNAVSGKKKERKEFSNFIKGTIGGNLYSLGKKAGNGLMNIVKGIRDLGNSIGDFIGPKVESFINFIKELRDNFIGPIAKNISDGIGGIFRAFNDTFSDVPIVSDIIDFFKGIGEAISNFISGEDMSKSFDNFKGIGDIFNNINTKAMETLGPVLTNIGNGLKDFAAGFGAVAYDNAIWFFEQLANIGNRLGPVAESIGNFASGAWNTITEAFSNAGLDFTPFLEFFGKIGDSVKEFIDSLTSGDFNFSTITDFFSNVWNNLGSLKDEVAPKIADALGQIGQAVYDKLEGPLKDLAEWITNVQNPLDTMVGNLSNGIDKLSGLMGVFSGGPKEEAAVPALDTENLDASLEETRGALDNAFNILEGLGTAFGALKTAIKRPSEAVTNFVSDAFWGISDAISNFTSSIDEDTINKFVSAITSAGMSAVTVGAFYEIAKLLNTVSNFLYEASLMAKALTGMANSFKKIGDAMQKNIKTQAVMNVAISVAILVGAIIALALLEANYADQANAALIKVIGLVLLLSAIITAFGILDAKMAGFDLSKLSGLGAAFIGIGIAVALLAASIAVLAKLKPEELQQGALAVAGILIVLSAGLAMVALAAGQSISPLKGLAPTLIAMGAALLLLGVAIDYIGHIDAAAFQQGSQTIIVALIGLAAFAAILGAFGYKLKAAGEGVMFFGIALGVMSLALIALSTQPLDQLLVALLPLAALILVVVGAAMLIERSNANLALIECSAGIIAFAVAIGILAAAIAAIAWVQSQGGDIVQALGILAVGMVAIGVLMTVISKYSGEASKAAVGMLVVAGALMVFLGIAMMMTVIPWPVLIDGLGHLAVALAVFGLAIYGIGKAATAGAPGLWSITLLLLGIAAVALAFSVGVMILVSAFNLLGAVAPAAAAGIVKGLQILNEGLAGMEPQIAGSTKSMVGGVSRGIGESAPSVANAGTNLIGALTMGILNAIPILVMGGGLAVLSLIENVASFIDNNHDRILDAIGHLLEAVGDFLLDGITHIGDWVGDKLNGLLTDVGLFGEEAKQKAEEARQATTEGMTPSEGEGGMADGMSKEMDNTLAVMDEKKEALGTKAKELKNVYNESLMGGEGVDLTAMAKNLGLDDASLNSILDKAKTSMGEGGKGLSTNLTTGMQEGFSGTDFTNVISESGYFNSETMSQLGIDAGTPVAEGFATGVEDGASGQDYTSLIVNDTNLDPGAIDAKFSEAGHSGAESFSNAFSESLNVDGSGPVVKAANAMKQPKLFTSAAKANGEAAISSFSDAVKKMSDKAKNSVKNAADSAKKQKSDMSSAGKSVGEGLVDGMISGVQNKQGTLWTVCYNAAKEAAASMKKGAKQNSPSKLTIPVGEGLVEGMVVGLYNLEDDLYKKAEQVGRNGALMLSAQAAYMTDFLSDIDDQPTIRPVLDLTDYEAGINRMNTLNTSMPMVAAGYIGASRAMGISNTNNSRNVSVAVNLNYDAGSDANQMAFELGQALETKLAMEGV